MSDLTIRRYRRADREQVVSLMERALRDANAYFEEAPALRDDDILDAYVGSGGEFLVGLVGDTVVATGAFRPPEGHVTNVLETDDSTAELKRMHVRPDYQRRGYASALLLELEARARESGFTELVLETTSRQDAAASFYRSHGFERVAREPVTLAGESFELHFYRKDLRGTRVE